jgi:hypothetical protein
MLERWNSGFSKEILYFKLYGQAEFCQLSNIAISAPSFTL